MVIAYYEKTECMLFCNFYLTYPYSYDFFEKIAYIGIFNSKLLVFYAACLKLFGSSIALQSDFTEFLHIIEENSTFDFT